jgi:hypothetical protein
LYIEIQSLLTVTINETGLFYLFLCNFHCEQYVFLQISGKHGAQELAKALKARGVDRLDFVLDEGFPLTKNIIPGTDRLIAMYVSRQQSAFSRVTITVSSDLFILLYIRTNYLVTKQKISSSCNVYKELGLNAAHVDFYISSNRNVIRVSSGRLGTLMPTIIEVLCGFPHSPCRCCVSTLSACSLPSKSVPTFC